MNSFVQRANALTTTLRWTFAVFALCFVAACQTPPPPPEPHGLSDEQIEALRKIGFYREEAGWELALDGRILFDRNDANLTEETRGTIENVVTTLKMVGINRLTIEGYTDASGDEQRNQVLSLRRAETVARYIASLGMFYEDLTVKARGMANPVADNRTSAGRAQNRRVVLIVTTD
jgi:outer membrane protein OmpA-like peptidoglycan-associated protein